MGIGLGTAMRTAQTGSTLVQSIFNEIGNNIANVSDEDATRHSVQSRSRIVSGAGAGVQISGVTRSINRNAQFQMWKDSATLNRYSTNVEFNNRIQGLLGQPGGDNSLAASLDGFKGNLERLGVQPNDPALQTSVLNSALRMAGQISSLANNVQALRAEADQLIESRISTINALATSLADTNKELAAFSAQGITAPGLEDQRDKYVRQLSELIDVSVYLNPNNVLQVSVGGVFLAGTNSVDMAYTSITNMTPASTLGSGINDITLGGVAITSLIQGGSLKGAIDERDTHLPKLQDQLDELSKKMRDGVNAITAVGAPYSPLSSLTSTRTFAGADSFAGTGTLRIAVINKASGSMGTYAAAPLDIDLSSVTTIADLVAAINTGLGANGSCTLNTTTGKITIAATGADRGIALGSQNSPTETSTGISAQHYFGFNDFFTTGSSVYGSSSTGVANNLAVNSAWTSAGNGLPTGVLDTTASPSSGARAINSQDNTSINALISHFGEKISFAQAGGLGARTSTYSNYVGSILASQSELSGATSINAKAQEILVSTEKASINNISGTNIAEEFASLQHFQMTFIALIRVQSAVGQMMQEFSSILR